MENGWSKEIPIHSSGSSGSIVVVGGEGGLASIQSQSQVPQLQRSQEDDPMGLLDFTSPSFLGSNSTPTNLLPISTDPTTSLPTTTSTSFPEIAFMELLRLGPTLSSTPSTFLHYLILTSLEGLIESLSTKTLNPLLETGDADGNDDNEIFVGRGFRGLKELLWVGEGLAGFLRWWKSGGNGEGKGWGFPVSTGWLVLTFRLCLTNSLDSIGHPLKIPPHNTGNSQNPTFPQHNQHQTIYPTRKGIQWDNGYW